MIDKIKELDEKDKLKLLAITLAFIIVVIAGIYSLGQPDEEAETLAKSNKDLLEFISDTAWTREIEDGKIEVMAFSVLENSYYGVYTADTNKRLKHGMLTFAVTSKDTLNTYNSWKKDFPTPYDDEVKLIILDQNTIKINENTFERADFDKWWTELFA